MVVRTPRSLVAMLACLSLLAASACSDVQHVVGKADLSATGGTTAPFGGSGATSASTGGVGGSSGVGGVPLGGAFLPVDAALPEAVPECVSRAVAERRRLNLYLIVDGTLPSDVFVSWGPIVTGIQRYASMSEAAGTGLGYDIIGIPLLAGDTEANACSSRDYRTPVVGIQRQALPAHADALEAGLENKDFSFNSMLVPAMEGALFYVRSVYDSYKEHNAVVLITDSAVDADQCGSSVASAADVARQARAEGFPVYVLENVVPVFGDLPIVGDVLAQLEPIATAGGTTARKLMATDDVAAMLLEIQRTEEPRCEFVVPEDYDDEQLQLAVEDEFGPRPFPRLDGGASCGADGGVYIDAATGFARACPESCAAIVGNDSAPIWVSGCAEDAANP